MKEEQDGAAVAEPETSHAAQAETEPTDAPKAGQEETPAAGGSVADPLQDDEVIDLGGDSGVWTRAELRRGVLRDADYRKKTTLTAAERKEIEEERKALAAERARFKPIQDRLERNPELVDALANGDVSTIQRIMAPEETGLDAETVKALEEYDPKLAKSIVAIHEARSKDREQISALQQEINARFGVMDKFMANDVRNQFSRLEDKLRSRYKDPAKVADVYNRDAIQQAIIDNNLEWEPDVVERVWADLNRDRLLAMAEQRGEQVGEERAKAKIAASSPRPRGDSGAQPAQAAEMAGSMDDKITAEIYRRTGIK